MRALPKEFTVSKSNIDGLGLFALEDLIIFPSAITHIYHPILGWLRTAIGAFINHSDNPNCEVEKHTIEIPLKASLKDINFYEDLDQYMLGSRHSEKGKCYVKTRYLTPCKDISKGEEITIKYEDVLFHGLGPVDYPRFSAKEAEFATN